MDEKIKENNQILIVDDNHENLELLSGILTLAGYEVFKASNSLSVLDFINEISPSVILLDIRMPELNGFDLCKILKDNINTSDIPLIFVSAFDDFESRLKGFELGAIDFITKPIRKDDLLLRIKNHVKFYNLHKELRNKKVQLEKEIEEKNGLAVKIGESQKKFKLLYENAPVAYQSLDQYGIIQRVNQKWLDMLGYNQNEVIGHHIHDFIQAESFPALQDKFPKFIKDGEVKNAVFKMSNKNGNEIVVLVNGRIGNDGPNNSIRTHCALHNITERHKYEAELKESEEKFKTLVESSPVAICIYQGDKWVYINPAAEKLSGYSAEELYKTNYWDFVSPDFQDKIKEYAKEKLAGKNVTLSYEFEAIPRDGNPKWLFLTGSTIKYKGNPAGIISVIDISEKREAEKILKESEIFYRAIFENNKAIMLLIDPENEKIIDANKSAVKFYGWTKSQLCSMQITDLNTLSKEEIQHEMELARSEERTYFELNHRLADKTMVDVEVYTSNIKRKGKDILFSIIHDVSEKKLSEKKLRESENELKNAQRVAHVGSWVWDIRNNKLTWSDEMYNIFGIDKNNSTGNLNDVIDKTIHPEDKEKVINSNKLVICDKNPIPLEYRVVWPDKTIKHVWGEAGSMETDENGNPIFLRGIVQDITKRKHDEEEIINERKLLRTLIDNLPDLIYVKDINARKIISNHADFKNAGYENENDVINKTDIELIGKEIGFKSYINDMHVLNTGSAIINLEEVFFDKTGSQNWRLTSKFPLYDINGEIYGLVGIGRDITEFKKAQKQIQKLTQSVVQSPSTIIITDFQGNIEYVNPKFTEITGYELNEVIGKNPRIFKSGKMPPSVYSNMWVTLANGEVWRGELLNRKKNGEFYWEWVTMTAIRNEFGVITNYLAIKEDITHRKKIESELIIAKEKAEESDKLKSAFLANMSHEIRTPLNSIIGFSELLSDQEFEISQKEEFINQIINNGNNLLNIISDILDISKMESGQLNVKKGELSLAAVLNKVKDSYIPVFRNTKVSFIVELPEKDKDLNIIADEYRLFQIFNNLIGNALKFTTEGYVRISYLKIGKVVRFSVTDTGIGIAPEYHSLIFERFRQVENSKRKNPGGNGLGLAITKNLIDLMGGKIWIESIPGNGSTFLFEIPVYVNEQSEHFLSVE